MVDPIPVNAESNRRLTPQARRDPFLLIWKGLRQPLLLVSVGGLLLIIVVVGMSLPQLPGQYANDPAGATRWLLTIRNEYGTPGTLLNGLGLFDLIHSPLIRFGLALLGLLLLIHLGEQLADLLRSQRLPRLLGAAKGEPGTPLSIPATGEVFRSRSAVDIPFARMSEFIGARLGDRFDADPSVSVRRTQAADTSEQDGEIEMRWLVQGHIWAYYVRPLLLVGLILALAVLWSGIIFGWEVTPVALAPDSEFHFPQRELHLRYAVIGDQNSEDRQTAALQVELGDATQLLAVGRTQTARINNTNIQMKSEVPGILLESDLPDILLLPGQKDVTDRIGFVFPAPGSEESVLIPDADVGLRLVRLAEDGQFLVEIVQGEGSGVDRSSISGDESLNIPLVRGSRAGEQVIIRIRFLPGLTVRVRFLPGDWLLWGALVLALAGSVGYVRRPFFTLIQLGPWSNERSVLVVQSSSPEPLAELEQRLGV